MTNDVRREQLRVAVERRRIGLLMLDAEITHRGYERGGKWAFEVMNLERKRIAHQLLGLGIEATRSGL